MILTNESIEKDDFEQNINKMLSNDMIKPEYSMTFSGTLTEIKSVIKCYGGELSLNQNGILSFHKSPEQTLLDELDLLEDKLDDP